MYDPGHGPEDPVPLADADIATRIARAARRGRGTDRTPTLEQLLSAFGEPQTTEKARRRAHAALALADVDVRPSVIDVPAGERVLLTAPGAVGARRSGGLALGALLALGGIVAVAVVAATLLGQGSDNRASSDLPPDTSPSGALTSGTTPTTTASGVDTTTTTTPATTTAPELAPAAKHRKKGAGTGAATPVKIVTVRVSATVRPTFLCVEDGEQTELFGGTLSGTKTFRARVIRLNIGLASTEVRVDGRAVPLDGSPAGLEVSRKGGVKPLPLGQRPCG